MLSDAAHTVGRPHGRRRNGDEPLAAMGPFGLEGLLSSMLRVVVCCVLGDREWTTARGGQATEQTLLFPRPSGGVALFEVVGEDPR